MILLPALIGGALAAATAVVLAQLGLLRRVGLAGLTLVIIAHGVVDAALFSTHRIRHIT